MKALIWTPTTGEAGSQPKSLVESKSDFARPRTKAVSSVEIKELIEVRRAKRAPALASSLVEKERPWRGLGLGGKAG